MSAAVWAPNPRDWDLKGQDASWSRKDTAVSDLLVLPVQTPYAIAKDGAQSSEEPAEKKSHRS